MVLDGAVESEASLEKELAPRPPGPRVLLAAQPALVGTVSDICLLTAAGAAGWLAGWVDGWVGGWIWEGG